MKLSNFRVSVFRIKIYTIFDENIESLHKNNCENFQSYPRLSSSSPQSMNNAQKNYVNTKLLVTAIFLEAYTSAADKLYKCTKQSYGYL